MGRRAVDAADRQCATTTRRAALWPRYHYLGLGILTLAVTAALAAISKRGVALRATVQCAAGAWAAIRVFLLAIRPFPVDLQPAARTDTLTALAAIRRDAAAAPAGDVVRLPNQPFGGLTLPWQFPGRAGLFVIHFPDGVVDGRPVRFLVSRADWERIQARGGHIAHLVEPR